MPQVRWFKVVLEIQMPYNFVSFLSNIKHIYTCIYTPSMIRYKLGLVVHLNKSICRTHAYDLLAQVEGSPLKVKCPEFKVVDFKPLAPHRCWFEACQGLWILSCESAIQLAFGTSVVLLGCLFVPEIMHGRAPEVFLHQ
jgi:hypothetical protein